MKSIVIIPARYGSSRFPGKPLFKIAGKTMLQRVCEVAKSAVATIENASVLVATDDDRILSHAEEINVPAVFTKECETGSDRCLLAVESLQEKPDFVVNLQGDAPLTPPSLIESLLKTLINSSADVVTPAVQLSWEEIDRFRESKLTNPFSGTTVVFNDKNEAIWFSKNIIPAIRKEQDLRMKGKFSPIFRHLGLYGYKIDMLERFSILPHGHYEKLEGLEQLRLLELGYKIEILKYPAKNIASWSGVDTIDDAKFVESVILKNGEHIEA